MGPLGWQEAIFVFILALLIFGPKKLPELGKTMGKAMTEFRRASNELRSTWNREMQAIERETSSIKEETRKIGTEIASTYNDAGSAGEYDSEYDYEYEDSYDYGATPDSGKKKESSSAGASDSEGAPETKSKTDESSGSAPEGTVPATSHGEESAKSGEKQKSAGSEPRAT